MASGGTAPPPEPQWGPPSLHLCETLHGLWDGARGFRAPHSKLPALSGLSSRRRYASCSILVSPGSCSDFSRDLMLLRRASARSMMARAAGEDDDAYSITGARVAEVTAGAGSTYSLGGAGAVSVTAGSDAANSIIGAGAAWETAGDGAS